MTDINQKERETYEKAKTVEDIHYACSVCGDVPEYCFECEKGLDEDEGENEYYCDGFGEHLCPKCYKKTKGKRK